MKIIKESIDIDEISQGDLVDFGSYGKLYVCDPNYSDRYFWVTDIEDDRYDRSAQGWTIQKFLAERIIDDYYNEDLDNRKLQGRKYRKVTYDDIRDNFTEEDMEEFKLQYKKYLKTNPDNKLSFKDFMRKEIDRIEMYEFE